MPTREKLDLDLLSLCPTGLHDGTEGASQLLSHKNDFSAKELRETSLGKAEQAFK